MEKWSCKGISSFFNKRNVLWVGLVVLLGLLFILFVNKSVDINGTAVPEAQEGVIDLSSWDFQKDGNLKLDGNWEFYWKQLLTYNDFQKHRGTDSIKVDVPSVWNDYAINNMKLPGQGYGTYRLHVKGNSHVAGLLGLRIYSLPSSYTLWVDNKKVASSGIVASSYDQAVPRFKPVTAFFQPPSRDFDIILQVANFNYARGGLWYSIYLGNDENILKLHNELNGKEIFIIGALFIMGLYSLSIYLLRREAKFSLYFSILCFLIIIVEDVLGQLFIMTLFPGLGFDSFNRIWYLSVTWAPFFLVMFINEIFPTRFSKAAYIFFFSITLIISLVYLFLPISFTSKDVIIGNLLPLSEIFYTIFIAIISAAKKVEGSLLYLAGITIGFITVIHDVLFLNNVIKSSYGELMFVGIFALVFAQVLVQAKRFVASYKEKGLLIEKLNLLDELKDEFLANTSHELRTPLNAIISIAEGMMRGSEGEVSPNQKGSLSIIASSGRRLSHLVNDILDYSKMKHNDIKLNLTPVNLRAVAENTFNVLKHLSHADNVQFQNEIPVDLPLVQADENRLIQIFYNLVGNAVKFTSKGYIRTSAKIFGGKIEVTVEDTGQGIPQDQKENIFKSFEQVDASLTRRHEGTGLGLAITKRLVELHQGEIGVESQVNQGSKFIFTLPVSMKQTEFLHTFRAMKELATTEETFDEMLFNLKGTGPHILVVDDNIANLKSAISILKLDEYEVSAVSSGKAALERIKNDVTIAVVILDVMMPGLSGYEVCREIRQIKSLFNLPVMMLTAKTTMPDIMMGFEAGANDYLQKPFEAEELLARVRTLVELKKSVDNALRAELKFLQSQIRPHFIHNALNTIISISRRDVVSARKLLVEFSHYLRNCFDFRELTDTVPLEKELNFVRSYVAIEQARFGNKLTVGWDIIETSFEIPPLIIQPLVENAIIHGLRTKPRGGSVFVYVREKTDRIVIGVKDDGLGIPGDKLSEVLDEHKKNRGVGIYNINQRLRKMYGISLIIESVRGEGTNIFMEIPMKGMRGK